MRHVVADDRGPSVASEQTQLGYVRELLSEMTLEEKIYQMFIVYPYQVTKKSYSSGYYTVDSSMVLGIETYPVGGMILDAKNIRNAEQLKAFTDDLIHTGKIPMLLTIDEEGGRITRLKDLREHPVDAMFSYKDQGPDVAKENAISIATDLNTYGFNTDFAPVADVWSNPDNTVIGDRAYSDDYEEAAKLVAAAVAGFHAQNIICTLKHFPGHGDTDTDSHTGLAHVTKPVEQVKNEELSVFKSGIEAGADMVMLGHLIVDELGDNLPATFSSTMVQGWLRDELDFNGVVVTDALNMGALSEYSDDERVVRSIEAGCDMILVPKSLQDAVAAVATAISNGTLTESRINESVERILLLKAKYGMFGEIPETTEAAVRKEWDDDNNELGLRPASLSVQLQADGVAYGDPVVLTAANGWQATVSNLPRYNEGNPITYTWVEETLPQGYTLITSVTTGKTTVLTNKYSLDDPTVSPDFTVQYY
ncbi:MAG: Cna B-type domain-containing protein, partial [Erysipelotrichaceae bacterium]|nr:Cna B-type domain-containing protein [Erysipelotrichaceae bacterium]